MCLTILLQSKKELAKAIEYQLHIEIREAILQGCSECEKYTANDLLRSGSFSCQSHPNMATYRTALVNPGITTSSTAELVAHIQDWVRGGPVVKLNQLLVRVNHDCPVTVTGFGDPECAVPASLTLSPQVIGAFNTCAIQSLGTQVCSEIESSAGST